MRIIGVTHSVRKEGLPWGRPKNRGELLSDLRQLRRSPPSGNIGALKRSVDRLAAEGKAKGKPLSRIGFEAVIPDYKEQYPLSKNYAYGKAKYNPADAGHRYFAAAQREMERRGITPVHLVSDDYRPLQNLEDHLLMDRRDWDALRIPALGELADDGRRKSGEYEPSYFLDLSDGLAVRRTLSMLENARKNRLQAAVMGSEHAAHLEFINRIGGIIKGKNNQQAAKALAADPYAKDLAESLDAKKLEELRRMCKLAKGTKVEYANPKAENLWHLRDLSVMHLYAYLDKHETISGLETFAKLCGAMAANKAAARKR